ncbi:MULTISPECIES: hypothetical protein [unclassified Streptomyces]|uniref:hypothetical protein n=1 Tax=unclassified Streptomyces TaxID=2593676 RepID=UPI00109C1AC5|nr:MULTISPECIES: hypothetical protein [unclassified Streptomyces]MCE3030616.1 hypothetical protein [Streptomyces sp. CMSTAAHL-2]
MTDAYLSQHRVTSWEVSAGDLPARLLTNAVNSRLFLLPDKKVDGVAIYKDDVAGLVKTLKHNGVDIDFAFAREDRRYLSEYGAAEVVAVIALAAAGNLTSDVIKGIAKTVWHRSRSAMGAESTQQEVGSANVTVKIAEIVHSDHETVIRGLEITSRVADVEDVIKEAISNRRPMQLPPGTSGATEPEVSE